MSSSRQWKVLLIGGSSGTGKTTVAREIANRYDAAYMQADDFRLALQRIIAPEQDPLLHFFLTTGSVWQRPPGELCKGLIDVGRIVSRALEIVVANHVANNSPMVLEGDGILPEMAAQRTFAGFDTGDQVRAVILYEPDEQALLESMHSRGRGFHVYSTAEHGNQVRASWLYGKWLRREAGLYGLSVLEARPWDSLAGRIIQVVDQ